MAGKGCICGMFVGERGVWDRGRGGEKTTITYVVLHYFHLTHV